MTPTELERRARRAWKEVSGPGEPPWDELTPKDIALFTAFASTLLRDFERCRERLVHIHGLVQAALELTEPVFQQEVLRRELEPPPPIPIETPEKLAEYMGMSVEAARDWCDANKQELVAFRIPPGGGPAERIGGDEPKKPTGEPNV